MSAAFRIIPAHDPSVQIEFEVPIKGRQNPIFFTVPKLQYFPRPQEDEFQAYLKDLPAEERLDDAKVVTKLLEMFVPKYFEQLSKLTKGELTQISEHWYSVSQVSIPESSASATS